MSDRAEATHHALIGAGANLGDRMVALRSAIQELGSIHGVRVVDASSVFETAPVGLTEQPDFLNLVMLVATELNPEDLLSAIQGIEAKLGRVRSVRWGPRTIDLDLLDYAGETVKNSRLELPHPRMWERAFVIEPLRQLWRTNPACERIWPEFAPRIARFAPATGVRLLPHNSCSAFRLTGGA